MMQKVKFHNLLHGHYTLREDVAKEVSKWLAWNIRDGLADDSTSQLYVEVILSESEERSKARVIR